MKKGCPIHPEQPFSLYLVVRHFVPVPCKRKKGFTLMITSVASVAFVPAETRY